MSCSMDNTVWEVSDVFGKMERVRVPIYNAVAKI